MAKRITINELDKSALSSSTFEDGKLLTTDTIKNNISSSFRESSKEKIPSTELTNKLDGRVDTIETLMDNSNEYLFVYKPTEYDESANEILEQDGIATVTIDDSFTLPNYDFNFPLNLLASDATKMTIRNGETEVYSFDFTGDMKRIINTNGEVKFVHGDNSEIDSTLSQTLFSLILNGGETITVEGGSATISYPVNQFAAELVCAVNRIWR